MKRALVVAHPDDESLFFGGLLIAHPGDWTVICCSIPRADPVRAWKFFDACAVLGAQGRLIPMPEPEKDQSFAGNLAWLDLSAYDMIVTHNACGEYGHPHHVAVNRHIVHHWHDHMITGGYGKAEAPHRIVLDAGQLARKHGALHCYDHVSTKDNGKPKWQALLDRYGPQFDLGIETYDRAVA